MKIKSIIILLSLLLIDLSFAQNVIIVVIDGARYTETFGAGATYIPHMYNDLKPLGAVYTNFRIADEGKTETNPGHSSILTGTWQQILNDGSQRPTYPTVFEYIRKEDGNPQSDCYIVTGKDKLDILSYSVFSGYGSDYAGIWFGDDIRDDALTYSKALSVMHDFHPKILLINFAGVDVAGHSGNWSNYLAAITNADNLVYQLWQEIQTNTSYQNNTTLFITNDHGRHDDSHGGFKDHGDDCEGCEHIMLLGIGRNVSQGLVNNDFHFQIDLAATSGDLLGFSTPQAVGTSLFQGSNPLPVELSFFSASTNGSTVKLSWKTETEVNNYGFEVERYALNAERQAWVKIGFVNGNGNSNSPKSYSYEDKNLTAGKYSYRLKQIDNDGQLEYSKTIEVDFGTPGKFELAQNFPNPFNPETAIRFTLPAASSVKLTVFNLLGQEVKLLVNEYKEAGTHIINFNASDFSSGVYIYRLETNGVTQTRKMTLVK